MTWITPEMTSAYYARLGAMNGESADGSDEDADVERTYCVDCGDADAENGLCLECREVEYDRDRIDER